jgi:hypothetical protein
VWGLNKGSLRTNQCRLAFIPVELLVTGITGQHATAGPQPPFIIADFLPSARTASGILSGLTLAPPFIGRAPFLMVAFFGGFPVIQAKQVPHIFGVGGSSPAVATN